MEPTSENVRYYRKLRGMTQAELAEAAGTTQYTVSEIELAHREPHPATLRKLAAALRIRVADFYGPGHDLHRWVQDKTTDELQQLALEEARYAKAPVHEEWLALRETDPKAWREEGRRRMMAYANIGAINEELERRGARSPVELAVKQFNEVMATAEETSRPIHDEREGQEAG